jgi:REP element-mobilizing transposase RayT
VTRTRSNSRQHTLAFRSWGGARRGAGRKPKGARAGVSHRARPALAARHPLHVTIRVRAGLPNLRHSGTRRVIEDALRRGADRFGWRLVHYSIQTTHMHFIAEARNGLALSRGVQGLTVRLARALNKAWSRRGAVFADRYHARALRTPREVRCALLYVLHNARRHGLRIEGIDTCSSGAWFDGWTVRVAVPTRTPVVASARTWLLRVGWQRHGRIGVDERPRPAHAAACMRKPSRNRRVASSTATGGLNR